MSKIPEPLLASSRELYALRSAAGLLGWDQETFMPAKGGGARAESQAALASILHEKQTSEAFWRLLDQASALELDDRDRAFVREARRDAELARRIPADLATDLARTGSLSQQAWAQARAANAPADFLPWLRKMVELKRREAECLGYAETPYDALLDQFEPGSRASAIGPALEKLRAGLVPLLGRILEKTGDGPAKKVSWDGVSIPLDLQERFNEGLLREMGFDLEAGRLDRSAHPFTQGMSPGDVRLTTRYREDDWLNAVFSTLHEGGHGLYEQGLPEEAWGGPLGEAASLSIHESQSRFWENRIGRSRAYWERTLPEARRRFGSALSSATVDELLSHINVVKPSLIRVEADEVTYNLHILLRFQLERAIFSGDLEVEGIEEAWNAGMRDMLGLRPPAAAQGFLQDVHWSCGLFGYFPTYAMGNLYAAQIGAALEREMGPLDAKIRAGEFAPIREWLREKIHRYGRQYSAAELSLRATGEEINPEYFLKYLEAKYL